MTCTSTEKFLRLLSQFQMNVLVLGIDAMSHHDMLRHLPLTVAALQAVGAVSLQGYNKVGHNTFPNVVPLMTGMKVEDLQKACPRKDHNQPFDACPFVWKQFAAHGFRTVYAEDCTTISTFNYAKGGFRQQPTDYYARPFQQVI
jgi:Protein of unknown function (DUF229)